MPLAPGSDSALARRVVTLCGGILLVGTGVALTIRAEVGVAPYDVLTTGLASSTGMPIGLAGVVVPVTFTLSGVLLGGRLGWGTAISAVSVGPVIAGTLALLPGTDPLAPRVLLFAAGSLMLAIGITSVIVADLGPGPAELLMLAIHRRGPGLAPVRTGIELGCVGMGWLLGGQVGVGTVVFAVLIGPLLRRLLDLAGYGGLAAAAEPAGAGP